MSYMPDEARAAMPNSVLQPLPPYLREDFSQSLDRSRPHELLPQRVKGKELDPSRCGNLRYRYTDTAETCTVPNIWYNQTRDMRVSWWEFEVSRRQEHVKSVRSLLAEAQTCQEPFFRGEPVKKAVQSLGWALEQAEHLLKVCEETLQGVKAGEKFL